MGPPPRYTRVAMLLHWTVAVLIAINFGLIYLTHTLAPAAQGGWIDLHMSIGLTVLGLVLLRLLWRMSHAPPPLPAYAAWERRLAHLAHGAFYVVMIVLPLSGWMHDSAWKEAPANPYHWFGLFEWPRIPWILHADPALKAVLHARFLIVHTWSGYVLYALVFLHVAAVLKHQFLDRAPELQRMTPGPRPL
jgi:cytochrome b561